MSLKLKFRSSLASDSGEDAQKFYQSCNRATSLNPTDILIFAYAGEALVGIVRLCYEHSTYVLRTMQVHESMQKQGVGKQILAKFKKLLAEQAINETYCMPSAHLEGFYGLIDFKKIAPDDAPVFLQERLKEFHQKYPDKSAILMKRIESI